MKHLLEYKTEFQQALREWYLREKREMPWRQTSNPYYIWVSEVMLQQTRVDTVIPYYERFIKKYPTLEALAEADEEGLLKMWEGLGYYSRARNLQAGVREVLATYGGVVPQTRKEISSLKGVGPYTAGAVLSIAYNVPEHAVDGNVMRVFSRLLQIEDDIAIPKNRKIFEQVVMDVIDQEDPSSFNQGVMELGATICTPKPLCLLCPVQVYCSAFHAGKQQDYPVKSKKVKKKIIPVAMFALQNEQGKWLMRQRPEKGLLANLWEFPLIECTTEQSSLEILYEELKIRVDNPYELQSFKHIFTHLTWEVDSYYGEVTDVVLPDERYQWLTSEEVENMPKPVPVVKIWETLKEKNTNG